MHTHYHFVINLFKWCRTEQGELAEVIQDQKITRKQAIFIKQKNGDKCPLRDEAGEMSFGVAFGGVLLFTNTVLLE